MNSTFLEKAQGKLEIIKRKWWLYLSLLLPIFAGTYSSKGYDVRQSMDVIMDSLANPFIHRFPILFPIAKIVPIILIGGLMILGNRLRRAFNIYIYIAILFLAIGIFQNSALTEKFGLVVTTGNLIMVLIVSFVWLWETFAERNDFSPRKRSLWKWWVVPLAIFALLAPVSSSASSSIPIPDFTLARLMASESGLTNCMTIPVVLTVLALYQPTGQPAAFASYKLREDLLWVRKYDRVVYRDSVRLVDGCAAYPIV